MNATTEDRPPTDDAVLVERVRVFREQLLTNGFTHANAAGEIMSADHIVWVGTSFIHGEIRIYMWLRPRGYGTPEQSCYVLVHANTPDEVLETLRQYLIDCAETTHADRVWPYPEAITV